MLFYYRAAFDAPSVDYTYYVSVDSLSSEPFDVKKFDETGDEFRFIVIGDVQNIHDTIRSTVVLIDSVFAPDFWVQAGDLIERPHIQYWDRFFSDFEDVCGIKPFIAVLGNHDFHKTLIRKPDDRFFWVFPYFENYENGVKAGVANFHFGQVSLYLFDTTRGLFNLIRQRQWLEDEDANRQDDSWKVVVMHHPPFSAKSAFNNLIVKYVMLPALNDADIDVIFSAHEHTYQRLSPNKDRIFYQYISHFSPKNYVDRNNKERYFHVVDASHNKMSVYTFNDSFEAIDTLNLER
jgi:3',5'-cyclic AMP phosphodiesterase CpdA